MTKWKLTELAEIAEVRAGSPAPQGAEYFDPNGFPFVRVQDVGRYRRTTCLTNTKDHINKHAIETLRPVHAKAGTIVFPKSGAAINTNSRAILGTDAYVVSHLAMITAKEGITLSEWLYFWFCSFDLASLSRTTSLPSVRLSDIKELKIPLPPLAEQRHIVDRIKEGMGRVEEIEKLQYSITSECSIMPTTSKYDLWNECSSQFDPVPLNEAVLSAKNGLYKPKKFHGSGTVLLRMFNIKDGELILDRIERLQTAEKETVDFEVKNGNIIVSRVNSRELVGKSAFVQGLDEPAVNEAMIIRLKINEKKADGRFLAWLMNSPQFLHALRGRAKHAIGQSSINQSDLLTSKIPLPGIVEQQAIVEAKSQLLPIAFHLQTEVAEQGKLVSGLRDSILRKAFEGAL